MRLKNISIILIIFSLPLFAQISSSYSRYGIGDIVYSYSARRLGIGQLGVSIADADFIGMINPAGWYKLSRTRIEFGIDYNNLFISDNNTKKFYADANFSGFTFAFPISRQYGVGAALGILPYSNVSYDVVQNFTNQNSTIGDYNVNYKGTGGLSKIFIGSSAQLPLDFYFGATLDYYFGSINYSSSVDFIDDNKLESEYIKTYQVKGLGSTLGLLSPDLTQLFKLESISDLRFGVSLNLISKLNTDSMLVSNSVIDDDTISQGFAKMKIPVRINAGLSFILNSKYLLSFDYSSQPWGDYSFNNIKPGNLDNSYKISSGFEYRPIRELGSSFWEQIIWRAGLSFEQTQYFINNENINQYSVHGGLSLPLSNENTIDFGIQYAMRGTTDSNLFKENIVKMSFGISLGELWFIRQEK